MAYVPHTSFTASPYANTAIPAQIRKKRTLHVFGFLSTLIFVVSIAAAAGSFFYKEYALNQLEVAKGGLQQESNVDNQKYIEEIRLYDQKLKIAAYLLDTHMSPSVIFEKLEGSVKETVQFENLEFDYNPGFEATLTVGGVTEDFATVALQKIQFNNDGLFEDFVLSNVVLLDEEGEETEENSDSNMFKAPSKVSFSVIGVFKEGLLAYDGLNVEETVLKDEPSNLVAEEVQATSSDTSNVSTPQ